MLGIVKSLLLKIVDDIDAGNSNLSEEDTLSIIGILHKYTYKDELFSKYQACKYLHISRSTFDLYIRKGLIPKGKKRAGFKELSWTKKDLDLYLKEKDNIKRKYYE